MAFITIIFEFLAAILVVAFSVVAFHNELKKMENEDLLSQSLTAHIRLIK